MKESLNLLIVEDEELAARKLNKMVLELEPNMCCLAITDSIAGTVSWLKENGLPDLILMDIELADGQSFEIFSRVDVRCPVIFTTAYDEFALKAFKVNSVDYLLKPVEGAELSRAIERAMDQIISRERQYKLISDYSFNKNSKLLVADIDEYKLIGISSIMYCKSDGNYTNICQIDADGNEIKYTDTHNLKYFEEKLKLYRFIRIHQSYLVNREHVTRIRKNPCEVILTSGRCLPVARDRKQDILDDFSFND